MPLTWPSDPNTGDEANGRIWDGDAWVVPASVSTHAPWVFEQPVGTAGRSVYCGKFWPTATDLPRFFWEAWVCPLVTGSGGYWISEGYGGAHSILCGPQNGNIWDGTSLTSLSADYAPEVGEWIHSAMSWDGTNVRLYTNGVTVAKLAFAGPRRAQQGGLYLGGSDHSNLQGRIAGVRGWEGADELTSPVPYFGSSLGFGFPFGPSRSFVDFCPRLPDEAPASFVMDFTARTSGALPDLSAGYGGRRHPGMLIGSEWNEAVTREFRPSGLWVADETCPLRVDADVRPVRTLPVAPSTPASAKIFDSFSRADSLLAWESPTLGQTEAGSLGAKTWGGDAAAFGVFDGRAVEQSVGGYVGAFVTNNSGDMDVRIDRRVVDGLHHTGLLFRAASVASSWKAYTTGTMTGGSVQLNNPAGTGVGTYSAAGSWTTLRVVTSGTTITVYTGTGGSWTQIGTTTSSSNQAEVGAGIYSHYAPDTAKRWDNFTVL